MGIYSVTLKSTQDFLNKDDSQGPIKLLYQRLHRRLERRRKQSIDIDEATAASMWPLYIAVGVLITVAVTIALLLLYP